MNLKNLFKAMFAFVFGITLFVACDQQIDPPKPDDPDKDSTVINKPAFVESDEVCLVGNCTSSDMSGAQIFGYGDGQRYTFGGATQLTVDKLLDAGYYIVGVRVYIGNEVESGNVFVGKDYENPELLKDFTYKKGGWQYILFDEPYDFREDTYIGFKATGSTDFMALESARKTSKTEMIFINGGWDLVTNQVGRYIWAIQAIVVGGDYSSKRQNDVVLERPSVSSNTKEGELVTIACEVRGAGIVPAKDVVVKCTLGGETKTINVVEKLMNGQSLYVEFKDLVAPAIEGGFENVEVDLVADYAADDLSTNNKEEISFKVYSSDAVERNAILVEQFTGQDCPNCPGGAKGMTAAISGLESPEKVVWVAHHTYYKDAFSLDESAVIAKILNANFAPACNINRMPLDYGAGVEELIWHPAYATTPLLERILKEPGLATIEINRTYADSVLTVTVSGRSLCADAYATVILTQSGMEARQAGVSGMYEHNNAPRAFLSAAEGDKLELDANGNYSVTYEYKMPEKVGNFECVTENMDVAVYIHGDISKSSTRMVYNADQVAVEGTQTQAVKRAMSLYHLNSNVKLRSLAAEINY